jgi:hypothetical protein
LLRGQDEKQEPQNYLKPCIFFGYFLCFKTKKVTWFWASKRNEQIRYGQAKEPIRQLAESSPKANENSNLFAKSDTRLLLLKFIFV